jgi:hypothetical protein
MLQITKKNNIRGVSGFFYPSKSPLGGLYTTIALRRANAFGSPPGRVTKKLAPPWGELKGGQNLY